MQAGNKSDSMFVKYKGNKYYTKREEYKKKQPPNHDISEEKHEISQDHLYCIAPGPVHFLHNRKRICN